MKSYKMQQDDRTGCYGAMLYFIILFLLICLCTRKASGQVVVYVLYQPVDFGIGVRVDYCPLKVRDPGKQRAGFYNSVSYGSGGLYKLYGLGHHYKFTTGVLIPLKPYSPVRCAISAGASYHFLSRGIPRDIQVNSGIFRPWSFELGVTVKFQRLALCVATDILRWEPCIGIGVLF